MRRALIAALLPILAAGAAHASEPAAKKEAVGQYVDLSPVALPIVANGRLVNYVFVSARINLTSRADSTKLREKEPYFRDALVRAGHRTPFTLADDYGRIDEVRMKATLKREAGAIVGAANIADVVIITQTAKSRVKAPRAKVAAAASPAH